MELVIRLMFLYSFFVFNFQMQQPHM